MYNQEKNDKQNPYDQPKSNFRQTYSINKRKDPRNKQHSKNTMRRQHNLNVTPQLENGVKNVSATKTYKYKIKL